MNDSINYTNSPASHQDEGLHRLADLPAEAVILPDPQAREVSMTLGSDGTIRLSPGVNDGLTITAPPGTTVTLEFSAADGSWVTGTRGSEPMDRGADDAYCWFEYTIRATDLDSKSDIDCVMRTHDSAPVLVPDGTGAVTQTVSFTIRPRSTTGGGGGRVPGRAGGHPE
ncbi:MAG: hypothetical protein KDK70_21970 [Myxococcales bacterium]|nr:hypothetical protein [Myxococcales bacterium]